MKITFTLLFLLLVATGCRTTGPHVRWYAGPPISTNEVALLKIQRTFGGTNLRVDKINGKRLDGGKRFTLNTTREIELLPGYYDLSVFYSDSNGGESLSDALIGFTAEAGKVYEMQAAREDMSFGKALELTAFGGRFALDLWILDSGNGKVVAGMPRETPLHWYEH
ncbi:MAG TPA: hypothetical protein VME24_03350 [Alphaproteobacteria bacterium]|nr:hypothetical protein [Alphaproteobacteria bacterium]